MADHLFEHRFGDIKQAVQIGVDDFIPGAVRHRQKHICPVNRGVIHQNINSAILFNNLPHHLFHCCAICDRDLKSQCALTQMLDIINYGLSGLRLAVVIKRHITAFAGKHFADCAPQSS
ncbi:MAG TPA: hypothetical protein PKL41_12485 [Flavobacteriales bacterium]|nr:hypothetical protein [Flavobacteriales bacterium]